MKVGIFGTGTVGRAMAERFLADGNEVMLGTRNVENTLARQESDERGTPSFSDWQKSHPQAGLGTFADTAAFGDIIVLATLGNATEAAIEQAGTESFAAKLVIDMTNPLAFTNGLPPRFTGSVGHSLGEQIQQQIPQAQVVKAFNAVSVHIAVSPQRQEGNPVMFIAGEDEGAKNRVADLAKTWGWIDVVDFGGIAESYLLESFSMMWIHYAFKTNSWTHAFQFLRK